MASIFQNQFNGTESPVPNQVGFDGIFKNPSMASHLLPILILLLATHSHSDPEKEEE